MTFRSLVMLFTGHDRGEFQRPEPVTIFDQFVFFLRAHDQRILGEGDFVEEIKKQIRAIVSYWAYQNDTPKSFRKNFKRIFSEDPPG